MDLQNSSSQKDAPNFNYSLFASIVSLTNVFLCVGATYYFSLLASSGAGGWAKISVIFRSTYISPIIGFLVTILILRLFNWLNKKTAILSLVINTLTVFNFFLVTAFGNGVSTISEYFFKLYGEPTIQVLELTMNPDATCNYKLVIKNNSPFPIINASMQGGSLIFLRFTTKTASDPSMECLFPRGSHLNIYSGEQVIEGTTQTYVSGLSVPTLDGLKLISSNKDFTISAYVEIEIYEQPHQLKYDYTEERKSNLVEMLRSLR